MALERGTRLGPYEILSPVGAGGMGEVYRAQDTTLGREVAIKILPANVASNADRLQRFEREARTVATLNHPNIVTIFGIHHEGDHRFIAMELVEGESLDRLIAPGGLPLARVFDIAIPLADALAAAHDKGIVHRDLKPANVMLTKEGRVKVLDFGLAKLTTDGQSGGPHGDATMSAPLTGRGAILGTVPYMSPEQLQSKPVDHLSDIFSLGVMLYEMAAGTRPFQGDNSATVMSCILRDVPRPVQELNSGLPRHLGRVIEHCLEKDPEHRYQSAKDVRNELRALRKEIDSGSGLSESVSAPMTPIPVLSAPGSAMSSGSALSAPTRRGEFWIGVAVIGMILMIGFWFLRPGRDTGTTVVPADRGRSTSTIASLAVLPLENLSGDREQDYFSDGMTDAVIAELAKISALRVISRTSVMQYKATSKSLPEIARELNVDAIVEGSVLRSGNRVRITAELIEAADEQHLWVESYEREIDDVLALQSEVARGIAAQVQVKLTPTEQQLLTSAAHVQPDAYDLYVRGMELVREDIRGSSESALELLDQAITIDPGFASAYVGRARTYQALDTSHLHPSKTLPAIREGAERALAIDPDLAEAHVVMGDYRMQHDWDWEGARKEYERALELSPNLASARLSYAMYLAAMKRTDEAMVQLNMVRELNPAVRHTNGDFASVSFMARRFEQTIRDCRDALNEDADFEPAHQWLGLALVERGRTAEGIAHLRKSWELSKSPVDLANLGGALASTGSDEEARAIRKQLKENKEIEYVCPYDVATISIGLHEFDEAFEEMYQACEDRAACVPWLQVDPRVDPLRSDPRFDDLLRHVGFEPEGQTLRVASAPSQKCMLAVLPFEDHSPEPKGWLASGLADKIGVDLGRVNPSKLGVLGPETTSYYAQAGKSIPALREGLKVDFVLQGSIQNIGHDVRISAKLIQADDLTSIWSEEFTGTMDDPFALQSMVAEKIITGLPFELTGEERGRFSSRYVPDPKAELAYLQGRYFTPWGAGGEKNLLRAVSYFEQAIEIDPNYALPYCGLVDAKCALATWGALQTSQIRSQMEDTVARALALDNTMAEAQVSSGSVAMFLKWDWFAAEAAFKRAIEINPNLSDAYLNYGHFLTIVGRYDEARQQFEEAIRLNPVSSANQSGLGVLDAGLGRLSEAERRFQKALEFNEEMPDAMIWLADVRQKQGRFDDAVAIMEQAVFSKKEPELAMRAFLGNAYAMAGRLDDARQQLAQMQHSGLPGHHMWFGELYAALGEKDEAFRRLDQALEAREAWLPHIRLDPGLVQIRSDPRFAELHRKMGLGHVDLSYHSEWASTAGGGTEKTMLAVLPFADLSGDPEQEYFSDGMTEEMITRLGRLRPEQLGVIARTSAMRYKNTDKSVRQIGSELGVAYVIEGGVRRAGDTVRINAHLIQVSDQTELWGDSYTRDLSDVFTIQAEVADAVAGALAVRLLPEDQAGRAETPTASSDAYHAYLLGRHYWAKRTPEALYTAIDHFKRAIALDPEYALAYCGLADAWGVLPWYVPGPYNEMYAQARRAAERALALDDSLAEAHVSMANVLSERGHRAAAEPHYQKALALDPNNATAHQWYGVLLAFDGRRDAAIPEFEQAITLDPLSAVMREDYCYGLFQGHRFDAAIAQCRRALDLQPELFNAASSLAWAYIAKGDVAAATTWFETYFRLVGCPEDALTAFRHSCAAHGLNAGLIEWLHAPRTSEGAVGLGPGTRAALHAWCGEEDQAFEWLDRALDAEDPFVFVVKAHPAFENLRGDPRWAEFLRKVQNDEPALEAPATTR